MLVVFYIIYMGFVHPKGGDGPISEPSTRYGGDTRSPNRCRWVMPLAASDFGSIDLNFGFGFDPFEGLQT